MKRYIYFLFAAFSLALMFSGSAEATKSSYPSLSCANVRCGQGTVCQKVSGTPQCVNPGPPSGYYVPGQGNGGQYDSPPGYYRPNPINGGQHNIPPGYHRPNPTPPHYTPPAHTSPPGYYRPNPPNYGQSCAYGGHYQQGRLICNQPPSWRQPYQNGWQNGGTTSRPSDNHNHGNYDNGYDRTPPGYYVPPTYRPQPSRPGHSRPGSGGLPDVIASPPNNRVCPMNYDPVCATKSVVCVKAPCFPVQKTFSNSCMAKVEEFTILYKGQC